MRIAIIGTGNVGGAIARGLTGKGHDLVLGACDPATAAALAAETGASTARPAESARNAGLVILALPWGAAEAVVLGLGDLTGQTVVDCMNPIGRSAGAVGLTIGHSTSGARWCRVGCRELMSSRCSIRHEPRSWPIPSACHRPSFVPR